MTLMYAGVLAIAAALYLSARPETPPESWPPAYPATVDRVIDGDTFVARIDLGLDVSRRATIRLSGVDAWEVRGPTRTAGLAARDALGRLLGGGPVRVRPIAADSFGRVLADVWAGPVDIDAALWSAGHDSGGPWGRDATTKGMRPR